MIRMRYFIRKLLLLITITLGWINLPAQAFLLSDDQNLWPVMSQQFSIPADTKKTGVRKQLDWDLRNPKYIHRLTENARPYLYTVFQETQRLHLPAELALLPMIESEYVPNGSSDRGAAGLWQLMPETASDYGIKMNSFYDGRRSTAVSTRVALHFLSYLYDEFDHNWLLALAAYNAGPGTVLSAIHYNQERGRPTDFWALPLPKETQVYIPKLLALAAIIQHPNSYGIHLAPVPNKAVTSTVTIVKQMKIQTIAKLAHTSVTTVKKLNPALRRQVTPPHQVVTLVLPVSKQPVFIQHLQNTKEADKVVSTTQLAHYTVQHGDSLSSIASKFKTTIETLKKINQLHDGLIHIHQALLVPPLINDIDHTQATKTTEAAKTAKVVETDVKKTTGATTKTTHSTVYRVRSGDNLGSIAHHFHVSRITLEKWNHLNPRRTLRVGEKIRIYAQSSEHPAIAKKITHLAAKKKKPITSHHTSRSNKSRIDAATNDQEHTYIVKRGDTLRKLGKRFDTTAYHIMAHNHLKNADLSIGQKLLLPNA